MSKLLRARNSIHFRSYFDAVCPLFWIVLYWQLDRVINQILADNRSGAFIQVHWWGGVTVIFQGDKLEAPAADPLAPLKPRWDDPVWAMDIPSEFLCPEGSPLCREPAGVLPHTEESAPAFSFNSS